MTTYTWPSSLIPNSSALQWMDNSARFVSPLSGATRTVSRPGGRWRLSMTFSNLTRTQAQLLEAFLWRLDGSAHRAVIPDHAYRRQATATGTPVVSGGSQTGRVLLTSGWTAGQTVMKAGDRFSVGYEMYVVASDAVASDGTQVLTDEDGVTLYDESSPQAPIYVEAGAVQLYLTAPLRSSPANGASLEVTTPVAKYMLADRVEVAAVPGVFKSLQVVFEEAVE